MNDSRILYTPPEFRKKKRGFFKRGLLFLGSVIVFVFLIIGVVYFLRMPKWQIRQIEISGLKSLKNEELLLGIRRVLQGEYFWFVPKSSALILESDSVKHYLESTFPRIAEAKVDKVLPDRLTILVREREFFGILCNDLFLPVYVGTTTSPDLRNPEPQCAYLDDTGFVYESGPNSSGSLIIKISTDAENLNIPSQILDNKLLGEMIGLRERVVKAAGTNIVGYEYLFRLPGEIKVLTGGGFKIIFSRDGDLENSFRVLKTVLEEEIKDRRGELEYIDLRFGNKVFYKFK